MNDEIIFSYSRKQALEDGVLIDVSEMAQEAGIKYPTAVTDGVWQECVRLPDGVEAQDEKGRLWDVLWMLRVNIANSRGGSVVHFSVLVRKENQKTELVRLYSVCGPGDDLEPVITIMLPHED